MWMYLVGKCRSKWTWSVRVLLLFPGFFRNGDQNPIRERGKFQLYLRGVGWEDGGESVEDLGAAALVVDELGLRDGERDGVGARGDEADPVPGLPGRFPGLLLLGFGAAARLAASLPLRSREGADAEVHLEPLLRRLRLRRRGGERGGGGVRRRRRGDRGNAGVGGGSGRRRGKGGNAGGGGSCCFVEEARECWGFGFAGAGRGRGWPGAAGRVPADGGRRRRRGRHDRLLALGSESISLRRFSKLCEN